FKFWRISDYWRSFDQSKRRLLEMQRIWKRPWIKQRKTRTGEKLFYPLHGINLKVRSTFCFNVNGKPLRLTKGEMKLKKDFLFIVIICVLFLADCGSRDTSGEDNGTLKMYTPMNEENAEAYVKKFEEETGIEVNYTRLSTGEILSKLKSENGRSDASIWFAGPSDSFIEADENGLLEKYDPDNLENLDKIDENAMVEDSNWLPIYQGPIAFASNEEWLEE